MRIHDYEFVVSVPWVSTGNYRDIKIWLLDNCRKHDYLPAGVDLSNVDNRVIAFVHERDAIEFALRWK